MSNTIAGFKVTRGKLVMGMRSVFLGHIQFESLHSGLPAPAKWAGLGQQLQERATTANARLLISGKLDERAPLVFVKIWARPQGGTRSNFARTSSSAARAGQTTLRRHI